MLEPVPHFLALMLFLLFGLCVGSFLNVMALRLLAEEDFIAPPSRCPHCRTPLKALDNIPVLSYLFLGAKCRYCCEPISVQYPLTEIATGLLFCLTFDFSGWSWQTAFLLFLIANLVVIFITDLREKLIYEINSLSLIPAGLLYHLLNLGGMSGHFRLDLGAVILHVPEGLISALIAMAIAFIFFEGMILLSQLAFGQEGFGHGDTQLMMGAGAFLGWPLTVLALILGFFIQAVPAIPMLVVQWIRNRRYAPLTSGGVALLSGSAPLLLLNVGLPPDVRAMVSLVCMLIGLGALVVFFRNIKAEQSFTYLPLGPALAIGVLVALFWGHPIIAAYQGYLAHR